MIRKVSSSGGGLWWWRWCGAPCLVPCLRYVVAIIIIFLLNTLVLLRWIGNSYVSDGNQVSG